MSKTPEATPKQVRYFASYDVRNTPYCCGFMECGNMYTRAWTLSYPERDYPQYQFGDSVEEVAQKALKAVRAVDKGKKSKRPVLFNFKKPKGDSTFEAQALLDLIAKEEDFQVIAEFTNPNTGNTIRSCLLMNGAKVKENE